MQFRIKKNEELYYLHSDNNGVDQHCSNRAANLHLWFIYVKRRFCYDATHFMTTLLATLLSKPDQDNIQRLPLGHINEIMTHIFVNSY